MFLLLRHRGRSLVLEVVHCTVSPLLNLLPSVLSSLSLHGNSFVFVFVFHSPFIISLCPCFMFVSSPLWSLHPASPSIPPPLPVDTERLLTDASLCSRWSISPLFFFLPSSHRGGGCTAGDQDTCLWADIPLLPPKHSQMHKPCLHCQHIYSLVRSLFHGGIVAPLFRLAILYKWYKAVWTRIDICVKWENWSKW